MAFLAYLKEKIRGFDLMGSPFGLNYQESSSYTTVVGGLFSCFILVFVALGFSLLFYQFIDRTNPEVTIFDQWVEEYPEFDLYKETMNPMIVIAKQSTLDHSKEPLESYITAYGVYSEFTVKPDPATGELKENLDLKPIPFVNCTKTDPNLRKAFEADI